jgi:hypothetical protein
MMVETFQMPNGFLITGGRCTGKTVLELNLREAICGTCISSSKFQGNDGICFIGRTIKDRGTADKILATAGSELLDSLQGLPMASWYIASVTPGYDGPGVMDFYKTLDEVTVISLFTKRRPEYYTRRTEFYSGYKPDKPLGPVGEVRLEKVIGKKLTLVLPHCTEQAVNAYAYILATLGYEGKEYDADIYRRPVL